MKHKWLCTLGFHKWDRWLSLYSQGQQIRYCGRCPATDYRRLKR